MQREDGWPLGQARSLGAIKQGREPVFFLGGEVDAQPREAVAIGLAVDAHVERWQVGSVWERSHCLLHAVDNLPPSLGPVDGCLDRLLGA